MVYYVIERVICVRKLGTELKKVIIFISCLAVSLAFSFSSNAKTGATYYFDSVEVLYAAEFKVTPATVEENKWFTEIAGGKDKPLEILYGIVSLKTTGYGDTMEAFIKITGENGSESFLHNGGSYYEGFDKTLFWSGKKLEGTSVVKDYSQPLKAVTLKKIFDENNNITSMELHFANEGSANEIDNQIGRESDPTINVYKADMTTLNTSGDYFTARNRL